MSYHYSAHRLPPTDGTPFWGVYDGYNEEILIKATNELMVKWKTMNGDKVSLPKRWRELTDNELKNLYKKYKINKVKYES